MQEKRTFEVEELRLSNDGGGGAPMIVGRATVYNKWSLPLYGGMFRERIMPGAATKTLAANPDVVALFNHDRSKLLGRTMSSTLRISEDKKGLAIEIDPPDTATGDEVRTLIKRGDISAMSFAFSVPEGGDSWDRGKTMDERTITEFDLDGGDVSPVTSPAYTQTSVSVRSEIPATRQQWIDSLDAVKQAEAAASAEFRRRQIQLANANLRMRG